MRHRILSDSLHTEHQEERDKLHVGTACSQRDCSKLGITATKPRHQAQSSDKKAFTFMFSDACLCLRLIELVLLAIVKPHADLIHHEAVDTKRELKGMLYTIKMALAIFH